MRLIATSMIFLVTIAVVTGCVAQASYTAHSVTSHEAAYRNCVATKAMERLNAAESSEEISSAASVECQGQLVIINDKLRQENGWKQYYGSYADSYTESLKASAINEASNQIQRMRAR